MRKLTLSDLGYIANEIEYQNAVKDAIKWTCSRETPPIKATIEHIRAWWEAVKARGEPEFNPHPSLYSTCLKEDRVPTRFQYAAVIYGYHTIAPGRAYSVDTERRGGEGGPPESVLARLVQSVFQQPGRNYGDLQSLCGSYVAYRPCWRSADPDFLIRSHIKIQPHNGGVWLNEEQKFVADMPWEERDDGVLFHAGSNIVCISIDEAVDCFKTYAFTDVNPPLSRSRKQGRGTDYVEGSVMAISSHSKKHWSGPIAMVSEEIHRGKLERVNVHDLRSQCSHIPYVQAAIRHIESWRIDLENKMSNGLVE